MRTRNLVAAGIASVLVLAACGSEDGDATDPSAPAGTEASNDDSAGSGPTESAGTTPGSSSADDAAFPVTIAHEFGETTIEAGPERVVSVGLSEQDTLYALGIAPVGVTEWFGGHDYAAFPWAVPHLDGATPEVLDDTDGIQFEKIAALDPDVIIGLYAGMTEEDYETLSAIAPTVAQPGEYVGWGIPWQEETVTIGRIVGKETEAQAMVDQVEALFAAAQADHPEFVGATAASATPYEGVWVYAPEDVRGRLLSSLGFTMPDELAALATDDFGFELSLERLDLLDVDALVWIDAEDAGDAFETNALYNSLPVHNEGREVFLDTEDPSGLGAAMSFVTVLSIPFLLDGVIPMLSDALDGQPS